MGTERAWETRGQCDLKEDRVCVVGIRVESGSVTDKGEVLYGKNVSGRGRTTIYGRIYSGEVFSESPNGTDYVEVV